jgi:hypothetical protein
MTTQPVPGTASGVGDQAPAPITDEQVIRWAAEAAGAGPATASTMRAVHRHFDLAKLLLTRRCPGGSGHLLESVELLGVQSGHSGTFTGVVLTVDLPPGTATPESGGVRLCTREFDLEDLVDPDRQYATAEELYTDLLTNALSYARDEIDKHRRALHYDQLADALAQARAAMDGGFSDAVDAALYRLTELVASILFASRAPESEVSIAVQRKLTEAEFRQVFELLGRPPDRYKEWSSGPYHFGSSATYGPMTGELAAAVCAYLEGIAVPYERQTTTRRRP